MRREDVRVCILRVEGTNCDAETKRALEDLGVRAEVVHINEVVKRKNLLDYDALILPGGFSYGDYVRAGAIWARRALVRLEDDLWRFIEDQRPVLGICNGFQVLVEMGLLPGFKRFSEHPEATLAVNVSAGYECRWVHVKHENSGRCIFTRNIPKGETLFIPVAHAEGRFIFPQENEGECLRRLYENDQLVFRYCDEEGLYAEGRYPVNPNGALHDIAGICDPSGTILGLMPHPERAYHGFQLPDWTRRSRTPQYGDGRLIFESMVEHLLDKH
ncbi:MAG: phosphoribosylformylglycinamidine synthase subunit PurQ [Candidatus Geothermarchaeales archaeon]